MTIRRASSIQINLDHAIVRVAIGLLMETAVHFSHHDVDLD